MDAFYPYSYAAFGPYTNYRPAVTVSTSLDGTYVEGVSISVETGSGHPGHIFSGSSGSDPVYNLSGSDPDWIT